MSSKKAKAQERAERAAALLAEQRKREQRRRLMAVLGVVGALVLIVGGTIAYTALNRTEVTAAAVGSTDYGLIMGEEDAAHDVVIYEDFLCPFCGQFEAASREQFAELADEGSLRVEYRPLNFLDRFGDYSERATNAFFVVQDVAGDDVAKQFHDLLFENQPAEDAAEFPSDDDLIELAVEAGATEADIRPGIENLEMADKVQEATDAASDDGVTGTPTAVFDGEPLTEGYTDMQSLADLIAERASE